MPVRAQVVHAEPVIETFEDNYHDAANRLERAAGRFAGSTTLPVSQGLCTPPRPWHCETRPGSRCRRRAPRPGPIGDDPVAAPRSGGQRTKHPRPASGSPLNQISGTPLAGALEELIGQQPDPARAHRLAARRERELSAAARAVRRCLLATRVKKPKFLVRSEQAWIFIKE